MSWALVESELLLDCLLYVFHSDPHESKTSMLWDMVESELILDCFVYVFRRDPHIYLNKFEEKSQSWFRVRDQPVLVTNSHDRS